MTLDEIRRETRRDMLNGRYGEPETAANNMLTVLSVAVELLVEELGADEAFDRMLARMDELFRGEGGEL